MKTIYVTIEEFEENGGILIDGRQIFNTSGMTFYKFNPDLEDEYKIYVTSGSHGGTVSKDTATVAILCTPVYI